MSIPSQARSTTLYNIMGDGIVDLDPMLLTLFGFRPQNDWLLRKGPNLSTYSHNLHEGVRQHAISTIVYS